MAHGRATSFASGPRARSGPWWPSDRAAILLGKNIAIRPAGHTQPIQDVLHLSPKGLVRQVCQFHWRHVCCGEGRKLHPLPQLDSPPVPGTGWRGRRAVGPTAICFIFAKFAGWVLEPSWPVCATCTNRSPPFFVRRIFPRLISSSTRDGSLASPCWRTSLRTWTPSTRSCRANTFS